LDSTPWNWKGVGCSTNLKVTSLNLHGLNLSCSLSTTLSLCSNLPGLVEKCLL